MIVGCVSSVLCLAISRHSYLPPLHDSIVLVLSAGFSGGIRCGACWPAWCCTAQFRLKGRVTMEGIVFSLKHHGYFLTSELPALPVLPRELSLEAA
jgi:hypothetical protein